MTFGLSKSRSFDEVWRDVHRDVPLECIQACMRCELACLASAEACLGDEELQDLGRCVRLSLDCAEVCLATRTLVAGALLRAPRLVLAQLLVCARMCATCEAECGRLGLHSAQIGRAARACADCLTLCFETTRHVQNLH
jgi:hypothetical protein